jgi:hypothetical protein
MKKAFYFIIAILLFSTASYSQQDSTWKNFSWLVGDWKGEGNGNPGQGGGVFSFNFNLDKKVIVRNSHSEYPAANDKPKTVHDDLMIIYLDFSGTPSKASYFDNEGHNISYNITFTNSSVIFLSDKIQNVPTFRLTYLKTDETHINIKFEMSHDGVNFFTYIEGTALKIKN